MVRRSMISLLALALAGSLALAGCGEDDTGGNNAANNDSNNMTDAGMEDDTGEMDTGTEEDVVEEGCTSDDDCAGTLVCDTASSACVEPPSGCEADPRPARCDEDPSATTWAPSSVVSELSIAGWVDANNDGAFSADEFSEDECCFDFDGDSENDNGLGSLLAQFGAVLGLDLPATNAELQGAIDEGTLIIVFEHEGLEALDGDDFDINFLIGELDGVDAVDPAASNPVLISPASFESGSYPQARIPNATLASDGSVTAGPGNARLRLDLLGATIELAVRQAQVRATAGASSTLEGGVALENGELGGFATVADLFDALNGFTSACECLGLGDEPLISYDPNDPLNTDTTVCSENATPDACTGDDSTCGDIAGQCDLVVGVGPGLADLDSDNDGTNDAISLGLRFSAAPATISGLAAQ